MAERLSGFTFETRGKTARISGSMHAENSPVGGAHRFISAGIPNVSFRNSQLYHHCYVSEECLFAAESGSGRGKIAPEVILRLLIRWISYRT